MGGVFSSAENATSQWLLTQMQYPVVEILLEYEKGVRSLRIFVELVNY